MLTVGLIGLGPEWEQRYRPALAKLPHRLRVESIWTPVIAHAEQVAAELECAVAPGLLALIERDDLRALLVLDTAWYAGLPAQFACLTGKPAFLAGRLVCRLPIARALLQQAAASGVTLMPDFGHRYTPATSRLRELIATRLGRPRAIVVEANVPPGVGTDPERLSQEAEIRDVLATAVDWCMNLVGMAPTTVRAAPARRGDAIADFCPGELHVAFRRPAAGGEPASACIRLDRGMNPAVTTDGAPPSIIVAAQIECANGTAWLAGQHELTWECGAQRTVETLLADRPAVEVMLDHFTRRVVGGLIPVATLDDVCRAFQLVDEAFGG